MDFIFQHTTPTRLEGKCWLKLSATPAALAILRADAPGGTAQLYDDSWQCQSNCLSPSRRLLGRGWGRLTARASTRWKQWKLHTKIAAVALNINSGKEQFCSWVLLHMEQFAPSPSLWFPTLHHEPVYFQIYLRSWGMPEHHIPRIPWNWKRG